MIYMRYSTSTVSHAAKHCIWVGSMDRPVGFRGCGASVDIIFVGGVAPGSCGPRMDMSLELSGVVSPAVWALGINRSARRVYDSETCATRFCTLHTARSPGEDGIIGYLVVGLTCVGRIVQCAPRRVPGAVLWSRTNSEMAVPVPSSSSVMTEVGHHSSCL